MKLPPSNKPISTASGLPGGEGGKGKYYSQAWQDEQAAKFAASRKGKEAQARADALLAQHLGDSAVDGFPGIKQLSSSQPEVIAVPVQEPSAPATPVRRVVADDDYDFNLDFTPDPPNPFKDYNDLSFDFDPEPVGYGSYDYDALDANSGPAYNPMTGYVEPTPLQRTVITRQVPPDPTPNYIQQQEIPLGVGNQQQELNLWVEPDPTVTMPQFNRTVDKGNLWDNLRYGAIKGFNWGIGDKGNYSKSVLDQRAPSAEYDYMTPEAQLAFAAGRLGADVVGHGTRSKLWNLHPEDFTNIEARRKLTHDGAPRVAQMVGPFATSVALGIGSGNYNPLNFAEGGRTAGFAAIQADPDDPTQSTTPVSEMLIDRGMFGRKGRLLPWEQFKAERPDVSYEEYEKYKDYLFNKDNNLLRSLTLGAAKGTLEGINGPELSVMGYSVTPLGAAAALGTLAAVGRMAKLR